MSLTSSDERVVRSDSKSLTPSFSVEEIYVAAVLLQLVVPIQINSYLRAFENLSGFQMK